MRAGRLAAAAAPVTQQLPSEADHEARVVAQVAAPEAARLLREPERPFEPQALEPIGRLPLEPGVEVEGGADPHEDRCLEAGGHGGPPPLPPPGAPPPPHHLRAPGG